MMNNLLENSHSHYTVTHGSICIVNSMWIGYADIHTQCEWP